MTVATSSATPTYTLAPGFSQPLGATVTPEGVNFSLFSEAATGVELLLFDQHDDVHPFQIVQFDPIVNKTFHFWHVLVVGLPTGTHYAYRVNGPDLPQEGYRFDAEKVLMDPYSKGNNKTLWNRGKACVPGSNLDSSLRCVVVDTRHYDWEGDRPLGRPMAESIIYEMHVGGFT
jgi:glycogen operon protein